MRAGKRLVSTVAGPPTYHLSVWRSAIKILRTTDTPASSFEDRGEVRVCHAATASGPGSSEAAHRCKNYGCQAEFDVRRAKPMTCVWWQR